MDLGIQHSLGSAAIHDLEDIRDRRGVKCLRRGDNPDEDVGLEYLDRLVREVSITGCIEGFSKPENHTKKA